MEVSDHVVVMNAGRVAQAGTADDVYDRPSSPFVASFVGGANILRGHMNNGRVTVGSMAVAPSDGAGQHAPNGTAVDAYVRPHDVMLTKADEAHPAITAARVERLVRLGAKVKISLKLSDGAPMTVEMAKAELDTLAIAEGDLVMADLRDAKIFVEDYSI